MSKEEKKSPETFIERCPHDQENPYAQISRALIRDPSISPECRWMLIYLLSMDKGWIISAKQLWNHAKGFIGQKKIYKLLKEACEAGYMKWVYTTSGNLRKGVKYYLSETPKFKNSKNVYGTAVSGTPKSAERKKELSKEKTYINPPLPPPPQKPDIPPPTKEEEEELQRRFKERPKDAPRIVSRKKWDQEVLKDIRIDSSEKKVGAVRFGIHKRQAIFYDGKPWSRDNDFRVVACPKHVEFTYSSQIKIVGYDVSDEEWNRLTGWKNDD